jgi:Flp pilus assembly protein TadG
MPQPAKSGAAFPYTFGTAVRLMADRTRCRLLPWTRAEKRAPKRDHGRGEEGAAIVEMAFSMIILLSVMIGLIETCLALYNYHYVSDAAREGSRYAIVHGSTCAISGVSCTKNTTQIQTYVRGLGYPGVNTSNLTVTTTYSAYPAGGTCVAAGCNGPGDLATVVAQYTFHLVIPFVNSQTLNMTSTSSMVIAQ